LTCSKEREIWHGCRNFENNFGHGWLGRMRKRCQNNDWGDDDIRIIAMIIIMIIRTTPRELVRTLRFLVARGEESICGLSRDAKFPR
jgi:hypothetical protein